MGYANRMAKEYCVKGLFPAAAILFLALTPVFAEERGTTPYGDYCRECSHYGVCKEALPPGEAVKAIDNYYRERGFNVGSVQHKGRFIEAEIYKNSRQVDKVLLDRKSGRLRSIY